MSLPIICLLVIIGIVLIVVFGFFFLGTPQIVAIFSDKHYAEVARGLVALKTAALAQTDEESDAPPNADDPRVLRTSADLVILYTIDRTESAFEHQYSISVAGRMTPGAVGEVYSVYVAYLLGRDVSRMKCYYSENRVFHTYFTLTSAEQEEFAARPVNIPSDKAAAKQVIAEVWRLRDSVPFAPMVVDVPRPN